LLGEEGCPGRRGEGEPAHFFAELPNTEGKKKGGSKGKPTKISCPLEEKREKRRGSQRQLTVKKKRALDHQARYIYFRKGKKKKALSRNFLLPLSGCIKDRPLTRPG